MCVCVCAFLCTCARLQVFLGIEERSATMVTHLHEAELKTGSGCLFFLSVQRETPVFKTCSDVMYFKRKNVSQIIRLIIMSLDDVSKLW